MKGWLLIKLTPKSVAPPLLYLFCTGGLTSFTSRSDIPCVVVSGVQAHGMPVTLQALVKVFIGKVLMPRQSVGVCEAGIKLQRPLEELEGILMFLKHTRNCLLAMLSCRPR